MRFGNPQRDVALGLAQQPVADHPALHLVAFGAGQRRIVDAKGHGQRRRIDRLRRQRLGHLGRAQRVRDERVGQAGDGDDVAGKTFIDRRTLQAAEGKDLGHAALLDQFAVAVEDLDRLIGFHGSGENAAGDDAAEIGVGFEDRAQHAERAVLDLWRRDMANDELEQRRHALVLGTVGDRAPSSPAWPSRRGSGNRAAPRWRRARRTGRTPRWRLRSGGRRRGRPC